MTRLMVGKFGHRGMKNVFCEKVYLKNSLGFGPDSDSELFLGNDCNCGRHAEKHVNLIPTMYAYDSYLRGEID